MRSYLRTLLSPCVFAAVLATTLVAAPAGASKAFGDCISGTGYNLVEPGWSAVEVRSLSNGAPEYKNTEGRTTFLAYFFCGGPGIAVFRLTRIDGVWRVNAKQALRTSGAPSSRDARTQLSVPAAGCLTPGDHARIANGWRLNRVVDLAGGPATIADGLGQPATVRGFRVCASPGLVLIRTSNTADGRFVTGKRILA